MNKTNANKIAKVIGKILNADCSVYDFDDETLYIHTGENMVSFDGLMEVKKLYNIEGINVDDECEGFIILQIDLRTEEERQADEELGKELFSNQILTQ